MAQRKSASVAAESPLRTGVGLRAQHQAEIVARRPAIGWFEAHTENYFAAGGAQRRYLEKVRADYPLSLHGVGLSLGSTDPLNLAHLQSVGRLVRDFEPLLVSEHLSWSSVDGRFTNDLLPLPYTEEALEHMISRVMTVQDALGRQILIENVSSYIQFNHSTLPEWEFLAALAKRSGCGILLDVNNVYVSACNHGFDAHTYIQGIPRGTVKELHVAGHTSRLVGEQMVLIDTHDRPVCDAVWMLYDFTVGLLGPVPTIVEWDADIPALDVLMAEAAKADRIAEAHDVAAA